MWESMPQSEGYAGSYYRERAHKEYGEENGNVAGRRVVADEGKGDPEAIEKGKKEDGGKGEKAETAS